MKLVCASFGLEMELLENYVTVLVVENAGYLTEIVSSLKKQSDGEEGIFVLVENDKIEKIDKNKIGLIICATMTPDYFTPSMACLIQERLGLNEQEVMCFDLNAACSGFVYALTVAHSLLQSLDDKYALIIGSEEISKIIDFTDRNTCVLFGDGAGAIVVSKGTGIFASYCNSSGNLEALKAPAINKNENNHTTNKRH